mmetsp:Transcript_23111/g.39699  ORF Transcript_23111/g.39699 Transcript_23111/m.39699 type:complete len:225 (+) Transcript_23111:43-717(+)|eukprot:CAMPEP_0196657566 /NCGR_PEP_ID=MMETSP1086-20130531/24213_1 /TAXON_ID=77921 /ORGANISM="Cyanoptyche  gloeocystis , Strain SAG4.97" /LENGTH=224 /DNA_ID=CAMNT_0041990747 /DNA_START=36 /DNA_END=710 /DNA_ORIENTATION=+
MIAFSASVHLSGSGILPARHTSKVCLFKSKKICSRSIVRRNLQIFRSEGPAFFVGCDAENVQSEPSRYTADWDARKRRIQEAALKEKEKATEEAQEIYRTIKKEYSEGTLTTALGLFVPAIAYFPIETVISYGIGAAASYVYVQLLIRAVDNIENEDWKKASVKRLAFFSAMIIILSQIPEMNIWAAFVGWNCHKVSAVGYALRTTLRLGDQDQDQDQDEEYDT